jgi:hypothetical protein
VTAEKTRQFLEQVVVWPGAKEAPGWINLHVHAKNSDPAKNQGKPFVVGWPFKMVGDLISRAMWCENTNIYYDAWYCTSQQSTVGVNRSGRAKAIRLHKNATALKAIWADIDVGNEPGETKHYDTAQEAWAAVGAFYKKVGLPQPSAVVNSGGGLHIYWISDVALSPKEWRPYAEGLKALLLAEGVKCDAGLTTDDARILRVPGTMNHKYDPPKPVVLLHLGQMYNFPTTLQFLNQHQVAPQQSVINTSQTGQNGTGQSVMEPGDWSAPDPAFAGLDASQNVAAGVVATGPVLIDPRPLFAPTNEGGCGFFREALKTGGAGYDNPLWNLSVLGTAFMENGNAIAHQISGGHASYSAADTQALYDRKVADRADRGIGYPSCATIKGAGCKSCATCPLFSKGKSPLNIRPVRPPGVTAAVIVKPQTPKAVELKLPPEYELNDTGHICLIEEKPDKAGDIIRSEIQLFFSIIDYPWVEKGAADAIHFRCSYDLGNTVYTAIKHVDWCSMDIGRKLAEAQIKHVPKNKGRLEQFFMAWLAKMHAASVAQTAQAFGWYRENGDVRGFAYGGFIHMDNGVPAQAGMIDRVTQDRFKPTGQNQPWFTAAKYITDQKRPELDVIIATAFAAPLMPMTGTSGAMISAWSNISGVGKTYAMEVGAAVWGHPLLTKETKSSSWKNIEKRLGATVNLPVMWDEITDVQAQKHVFDMVMITTSNVGGGKLKQNRDFAEKNTWSTIVSINSNLCFKDYVVKNQPTHCAGLNRVLEYQIHDIPETMKQGMISPSTAGQALTQLQHHFGNLGMEYARVLGTDNDRIQARVTEVLEDLESTLNRGPDDRYYIGMIAALLVGAEEAVNLGVEFDVPALRIFLKQTYYANQAQRAEANVNVISPEFANDLLTAFIKDHIAGAVWTKGMQNGAGKPSPVGWRRLFPNAPMPHGVVIRLDETSRNIAISKRGFETWCLNPQVGQGISPTQAVQALKNKYVCDAKQRRSLGSGTPFPGGQEPVIIIDVAGHQDLEDLMNSQGPDNSALGVSTGIAPTETAA